MQGDTSWMPRRHGDRIVCSDT